MNDVRIKELNDLNLNYHSGATKEVLYRCTLLGPFVLSILEEFPEYNKEEVMHSFSKWLDLCDKNNLELVESLIELFSYNSINNTAVDFYENYTEVFEKMIDFLLGKVMWEPNENDKAKALYNANEYTKIKLEDDYHKDVAVNNLTAQKLNDTYYNK
jgi:hypothetical protein